MKLSNEISPSGSVDQYSIFRNFCDKHCKVNLTVSHEEFYTNEELRKMRQKRPKIQ
jgi:hypothetical protein